ncbi:MAG: GreA/GreB family elongation factor, partial [Pseudomonadota bacterium]
HARLGHQYVERAPGHGVIIIDRVGRPDPQIARAQRIDPDAPPDRGRIFFGARVSLEDAQGRQRVYRIVGPDEFDIKRGDISVDAPLARALLKKTVDDEVSVPAPEGPLIYYVVDISYPAG